jgi:ATP-dependent Clp protease adaptor protein ClpS
MRLISLSGEPARRIAMSNGDVTLTPKTVTTPKTERPRLYKVILVNDDYTPREFVVLVLKAVFRMNEDVSHRVMVTAHKMGTSVVTVCARDLAETKAKEATDLAKEAGFPLLFHTEPEK